MKKSILSKLTILAILLVGALGVTVSARVINGVRYSSFYVQADGGATVPRMTLTGGRVRGEVCTIWNTNGTKQFVFEKHYIWRPNIAEAYITNRGLSRVVYGAQANYDCYRLRNYKGYTR